MSIVWQKIVQIKIGKSTYTAAIIYATRICHREQCAFCENICQKYSNPRIHIRKVYEGNSVPLWKCFPTNQQSQNTYKKSS